MLFNYKALDTTGVERDGSIEAINIDIAITSLQRRGLVISKINSADEPASFLQRGVVVFKRVTNKEVVILSRQLAILFDAQVSALRVFRLIASEIENQMLRKSLTEIADDIQGGSSLSKAMQKHPKIFSEFYVNMVKSGEESGRLNEIFLYLADSLERTYEVSSKARNALIYPAFVIFTFFAVMGLMFTVVIPKISVILVESGQELPVYTAVVLAISNFLVHYGIYFLIAVAIAGFFLVRYSRTPQGKEGMDKFKISIPFLKNLYKKLYVSRITDNMNTMLTSGIPMIKSLEITASVVGNEIYRKIVLDALNSVKGGKSLSDAFVPYHEIPGIVIQMVKVGEETGELGNILKTLSKFYQREVMSAVDTLVDLIEPIMIVMLGLGVGILLASVLVPIYNLANSF